MLSERLPTSDRTVVRFSAFEFDVSLRHVVTVATNTHHSTFEKSTELHDNRQWHRRLTLESDTSKEFSTERVQTSRHPRMHRES